MVTSSSAWGDRRPPTGGGPTPVAPPLPSPGLGRQGRGVDVLGDRADPGPGDRDQTGEGIGAEVVAHEWGAPWPARRLSVTVDGTLHDRPRHLRVAGGNLPVN